jgi:hypothetical protein
VAGRLGNRAWIACHRWSGPGCRRLASWRPIMTLNRRVATTSRSSETRSTFRHEDDTALLPAISHSGTFVPAMPPAQPLAARQARTAAETGSVVARLRYLTAGGAILAALPGATVLEPDEATDGGRSTKGFLGGAIASALKESGDETLAHDNCSPAPPVDPRPSAFAGPGPSFPRVIQVACSAAICVAVSSKSDGFSHLQCRRTLTSSKLADSI